MFLAPILSALVLVVSTFAQDIQILSPVQNQTVVLGNPLVVTVSQPGSLGPLENVAIVIGIEHCGTTPCSSDENQVLGQIVAKNLFNPTRNSSEPSSPPGQSFTIIPSGETGFATLHASVMVLTGVSCDVQCVTPIQK